MEWLLLIPLLAIGLFVCLLVGIWLADIGYSHFVWALGTLEENLQRGAVAASERLHRSAIRRRYARRFAMAAGTSGAVDEEAVEAARLMPVLRNVLNEELLTAILRCLRMHRFSASMVDAHYIGEVAYEPECLGSRQRVVALAETAMGILEGYGFLSQDEKLMANLVRLRTRIVPTCSHCPYLKHRTDSAPLLCPSAQWVGINPEDVTDEKQI